jgi:hypothetical protein
VVGVELLRRRAGLRAAEVRLLGRGEVRHALPRAAPSRVAGVAGEVVSQVFWA